MTRNGRCDRCGKPLLPRGVFACRAGYPDHVYPTTPAPAPVPTGKPGKLALFGLLMKGRRLFSAVEKEEAMGYDPKITIRKGALALLVHLLKVALLAILAALMEPALVGRILHEAGVSVLVATAFASLAAAGAEMLRNYVKHSGDQSGTVIRFPPAAGLVLLMVGMPLVATAELVVTREGVQVHSEAHTWKTLLRQQGVTDDAWGGRVTARVSGLPGGLEVSGRVDINALRPVDLGNPDVAALKTVETYVAAHRRVLEGHGLALSPAIVLGRISTFDSPGRLRAEHPRTLAGGVRVSWRRAWIYALAGEHQAAGPGIRVLVAGHLPIRGSFGVAGDFVSGIGGFSRLGATVRLPAPW